MKKPEPNPEIALQTAYEVLIDPKSKSLFDRADQEYLSWDEVKHKHWIKEAFDPTTFWGALSLTRGLKAEQLSLLDIPNLTFSYAVTSQFLKILSDIEYQLGRDHLTHNYDDPNAKDRVLLKVIIEEAIASSQLEGAVTTTTNAEKMLANNTKPKDQSSRMIYNNYKTIQHLQSCKDQPMSFELLCQIQQMITLDSLEEGIEPGEIRNNDQVHVVDVMNGEIIHTPVTHQVLHQVLPNLIDFINDDPKYKFIPHVIKGIIIHFLIGYLHPFPDGNGRTARALFYWYILRKGYWFMEYLSISRWILDSKSQYYRAYLLTEHNDNDLNYFIQYNLLTLGKAYQGLSKYLEKQKALQYNANQLMMVNPDINPRQAALLSHWQQKPGDLVTIAEHQFNYQLSYQTARTDLHKLLELNLITMQTHGKKQFFFA